MATERTKTFRILYWSFFVLSLLCNIGPLLGYGIKAYVESDLTHEKVTLTMTVLIVAIMTVVSILNKVALRSRIWILLIGIYFCLDNILTMVIIIAVTQILDELVITPLKKHFKTKLTINKEMDKRTT